MVTNHSWHYSCNSYLLSVQDDHAGSWLFPCKGIPGNNQHCFCKYFPQVPGMTANHSIKRDTAIICTLTVQLVVLASASFYCQFSFRCTYSSTVQYFRLTTSKVLITTGQWRKQPTAYSHKENTIPEYFLSRQ